MSTAGIAFRHEIIDPDPPGAQHDITLIADINGNGRNDIVIGGKVGDPNLFWYENPSWARHDIAIAPELEAGGVVVDINGNGRLDIVAGQQIGGNELYWFECPPDPTQLWTRRVIEDRFQKYHDQAIGDVDGDGEPELVFLSQRAGILAYYDIPSDPTIEPWPEDCFHLISEEMADVEGLAIVDIDGNGVTEIIAGTSVCRPTGDGWTVERYLEGYVMTRVAVADLDGDGALEIVVCEGESDPGRLAVCKRPDWTPHVLRDDLFHPHSLEIADFNGDGHPDVFVAEMGLGKNDDPEMLIFLNDGEGGFEQLLVQRGMPTHEAKVGDLTGNGLPDIVGKPYDPERHIDAWINER